MRNISKDLYNISKIRTKGKCIIDGCERETQEKSHSISESILNYIKGDSELFQIQFNNSIYGNVIPMFEKVTNKVGVFYNFLCHEHDYEIFKIIENTKEDKYGTDEKNFLYCFKTTLNGYSFNCRNMNEHFENKLKEDLYILRNLLDFLSKNNKKDKKEIISKFKKIIKINNKIDNKKIEYWEVIKIMEGNFDKNDFKQLNFFHKFNGFNLNKDFIEYCSLLIKDKENFLNSIEINRKNYFNENELEKLLKKMKKIFQEKSYSKITTKVIVLEEKVSVVANSLFLNNVSDTIFFSMFPDKEKTICLVSYFTGNKIYNKEMKKIDNDLDKLKDVVLNLIMAGNNTVFNKEFIENKLKNKLEKNFLNDALKQKQCNNVFSYGKNSIYNIL